MKFGNRSPILQHFISIYPLGIIEVWKLPIRWYFRDLVVVVEVAAVGSRRWTVCGYLPRLCEKRDMAACLAC